MDISNVVVLTMEDLKALTNNFNKNNLIGVTQFGKLYRGQMNNNKARDVTVKIFDIVSSARDMMLKQEVEFLKGHPNLVKLIGYCCDQDVVRGLVFDLNVKDTLHNLILKDELSWIQRVNIIVQLASLVEFLHGLKKPCLFLNMSYSPILLDWDFQPKLCEFIGGRINTTLKKQVPAMSSTGFVDSFFARKECDETSNDVFSFGVVVLGLISKRMIEPETLENMRPEIIANKMIQYWAKNEYKPNSSLVHKSLQQDWAYNNQDGIAITKLGMRCIEFFAVNRPTMKDVYHQLQSLLVLQRLGDTRPYKREKKFHGGHEKSSTSN